MAGGTSPPAGDFYAAWIRAQLQTSAETRYLPSDEALVAVLLLDPSSPYSRRRQETRFGLEGPIWRAALAQVDDAGHPMTSSTARDVLAWDLGLYKALPRNQRISYEIDRMPPLARANLVKAGVAHDIYRKALHLIGKDHFAIAAQYAVAVQVLHERAALLPEDQREHSGLRASVLRNFMSAGNVHDMVDGDWDYLIRRLQGRLGAWEAGKLNRYGQREIATTLRVARVAAAYREEIGYTGPAPCDESGTADRAHAALVVTDRSRDLCTTDATDRAVYAWYRQQLADQLLPVPSRVSPWSADMAHIVEPVSRHKPLWQGTFPDTSGRHALHTEVKALLLAQSLAEDPEFDEAEANRIAETAASRFCEAR